MTWTLLAATRHPVATTKHAPSSDHTSVRASLWRWMASTIADVDARTSVLTIVATSFRTFKTKQSEQNSFHDDEEEHSSPSPAPTDPEDEEDEDEDATVITDVLDAADDTMALGCCTHMSRRRGL
jgi:hypothetical protein